MAIFQVFTTKRTKKMKDFFVYLRLKEVLAEQKIKITTLGNVIGCKPNTLSIKLNGKHEVDTQTICNICAYMPMINTRWLLLGVGDKYVLPEEQQQNMTSRKVKVVTSLTPHLDNSEDKNETIQALQQALDSKQDTIDTQRELIQTLREKIATLENK